MADKKTPKLGDPFFVDDDARARWEAEQAELERARKAAEKGNK